VNGSKVINGHFNDLHDFTGSLWQKTSWTKEREIHGRTGNRRRFVVKVGRRK
jgi:hypothetical protein